MYHTGGPKQIFESIIDILSTVVDSDDFDFKTRLILNYSFPLSKKLIYVILILEGVVLSIASSLISE